MAASQRALNVAAAPRRCHSVAPQRLHSQLSRSSKHRLCAGIAGSDKVQQVREQAKTKLDKVVEDVEDKIDDDDSAGAMEELVGPARFKDKDLQVFKSLIQSMRDTAWGLLALASSVVALALAGQVGASGVPDIVVKGISLSRYTHTINALLVAALFWMGAISFRKVLNAKDEQLAFAFQGIVQIGVIFNQIGPITLSFAIINLLEASVRWPGIVFVSGITLVILTILRALSLTVLFTRYAPGSQQAAKALLALRQGWDGLQRFSLIDRGAIMFSAGMLLPYTAPEDTGRHSLDGQDDGAEGEQGSSRSSQSSQSSQGSDEKAESSGQGEYEFSQWEERVLEMVMEALRMSGLALLLQAISTTLLGTAILRQSGPWAAHSLFTNELVDQSVRAYLLFTSASCFADILSTRGRDQTLLLQGLGQQQGLGQLFRRMAKLAWGMAGFRVAQAALPQTLRIHAVRRVWEWAASHAMALLSWAQHVAANILPGPLATFI